MFTRTYRQRMTMAAVLSRSILKNKILCGHLSDLSTFMVRSEYGVECVVWGA